MSSSESLVWLPPNGQWVHGQTYVQTDTLCGCLLCRLLEALLSASTMLREAMPTDELAGKHLGSVQRKVQEVVVKVTNLLSLGSFLEMIGQLIAGSSPLVQHQALGLLALELRGPREVLSGEHVRRVRARRGHCLWLLGPFGSIVCVCVFVETTACARDGDRQGGSH